MLLLSLVFLMSLNDLWSPYTLLRVFPSGVPTPPQGLTLSHREGNSVIVQWSLASPSRLSNKTELPVLGYQVYVDGRKRELVRATTLKGQQCIVF